MGTTLGTKGQHRQRQQRARPELLHRELLERGHRCRERRPHLPRLVGSIIQNNTVGGILSSTAATTAGKNRVSIANTALLGNGYGVRASLNTRMQVNNSLIANSPSGGGAIADASTALLVLTDTTITNNSAAGFKPRLGNRPHHEPERDRERQRPGVQLGRPDHLWGNNHVADNPGGDGVSSSTIAPI